MKSSAIALLLLASLSWVSGCSRQDDSATRISGTLNYREPVNFETQDTVLQLRLTDVSVTDGPALEVATIEIDDIRGLPYQYSLPYDASKIDAEHRYTIDARILSGDTLRYSTDTAYPVLTQGNGTQRNLTLIAVGENSPSLVRDPEAFAHASVFHNELRAGTDVSLYKAGFQDGHLAWLEEDRSNGTPQPLHARYEFKGALVMRYVDTSPMEVNFDERGRPTGMVKNGQALKLSEQTAAINAVRNRAALLRSHALAASETRAHRQATGG